MSAYSCGPGRGSEPGAGWAWARAAAQQHDVWLLTHATNEHAVTTALSAEPDLAERLHPVYLRSARWARPLRRRGPTRFLYCMIWQLTVCRQVARALHASLRFDVAHHVTYASDWLPVGVSKVRGLPFVWGPVGGSSTNGGPRLWRLLGPRASIAEAVRALLLTGMRQLVGQPVAGRAAVVLGQNHDVAKAFAPVPVRIEPHVALDPAETYPERRTHPSAQPIAVFAGRLLAWKGLAIALAALRHDEAAHWRLHLYGDGRERVRLERLAERWHLTDRVTFLGARPRAEVRDALAQANVMLFPSIHDAAGWSVAEAIEAGCPVVALDVAGPAALAGPTDAVLVDPAGDVVGDVARALGGARHLAPEPGRWSATRLSALLDDLYRGVTRGAAAARKC